MSDGLFDIEPPYNDCGRDLVHGLCPWCTGKPDGQTGIDAAARNSDPEWAERADEWLGHSNAPGFVITADDLIEAIGLPTGSENQIGARFQTWRKAGRIRQAGVATSRRRSNHGRLLRAWEVIA